VSSGSEQHAPETTDWGEWLARYAAAFLLFARQQVHCDADAQDLVQDAVVESWQNRPPDGPPPGPGLVFATIRRRAVDLARRNNRRAHRETAAQLEAPQIWFDSRLEDRERAALLQEGMKQLPEIYRDVLTLKIWGGLTFPEIAEALEIPANTASSRYRYGLIELRKWTKDAFA